MTKFLGIDYGRSKIGLAISEGFLAEPLEVIRDSDTRILRKKMKEIVDKNKIEKIVIGISEGEMAKETMQFLSTIRSTLPNIPVETHDETLSTQDAQRLAIEAHLPRGKRKSLEDAFAAAVMLQSYLDAHV